jgi:adenine-specific DNA-methyltransferase
LKPELTSQKLRGGYYTPAPIAEFLAQWAIRSPQDMVLEPSCGDGNLLITAAQTLLQRGATPATAAELLYGIELDLHEAAKAAQQLTSLGISDDCVHIGDFFVECQTHFFDEMFFNVVLKEQRRFDVVIGNPPFIRYQNFLEESRKIAFRLMERAGLHPNRLTNAWLPFLVVSSLLLNKRGRLAMVIPAELFQVNYAAEVRKFLSDFFSQLTIITFEQLVFEGIQQEVVLLLGEHQSSENGGIRVVELQHIADLHTLNLQVNSESECKPMDHSTEKWTQYFLSADEIQLLRTLKEHPLVTISGRVLDVDVGIVTGNNDFFILTRDQVQQHNLEPYLDRIVVRSGHLCGAIFSGADWFENEQSQFPALFFTPPDKPFDELPESLQKYIAMGETAGYNQGYKCRIRKRWYLVPSVWVPDAFMLRQVHGYPKLILNTAEATSTDTIHRVRFRNNANGKTVTAAFLNSLTFAFAEVTGRSYGGGVLTFEPTECERLPLPLVRAEQLDLDAIDQRVRKDDLEAVLDVTDKILLIEGLGLSPVEAKMLRGIWEKLRDRRIQRKHTPSKRTFSDEKPPAV